MVSKICGVLACCVAATVTHGQSSQGSDMLPRVNSPQQFSTPPPVITSRADIDFWATLVTQGSCTPSQLVASLTMPNARQACGQADVACQGRVGVAVLRACMTGPTITQLCEASVGPIDSAAFEDCIAQQINNDTRPVYFELSSEQIAVVDNALEQLQSLMPTQDDIRAMTDRTLPERQLIADAVSQFKTPSTISCNNLIADQQNFCSLQQVATTAETKLGAASYILGQISE